MLWLNTEPNADPALTVAVPVLPFSNTDSAAAWAKAQGPRKASARVRVSVQKMRGFISNSSPSTENSSPEQAHKQDSARKNGAGSKIRSRAGKSWLCLRSSI
jgi:hypothetical protein